MMLNVFLMAVSGNLYFVKAKKLGRGILSKSN